jgi:hypothetical protein
MQKTFSLKCCALLVCLFSVVIGEAQSTEPESEVWQESFEFLSPQPNSKYHNINCLIALRTGDHLNISDLQANPECLTIQGLESGSHEYDLHLAADGKTINIKSREDFFLDEEVIIHLGNCLKSAQGEPIASINWSFQTSEKLPARWTFVPEEFPEPDADRIFPTTSILIGPEPGVFDGNFFIDLTAAEFIMSILNANGTTPPLFQLADLNKGNDFKINRNGLPTYHDRSNYTWGMMDGDGVETASFDMLNGYLCDNHDFQILPDGKHFLFAYDDQVVDMSEVVPGGNPAANVEGFIIHEIDSNGDLMFEWRSWDYLEITDNEEINLTGADLNLFHINAIDVDSDDNLLISLRNTSDIIKYDRNTGEIIWRFSNNSHNEFQFLDQTPFSYQHDIRRLDNGNLLLFDNANLTSQVSRVVEYSLNLETNQATTVWEFIHPDLLYGSSMGGSQRLPNGNTVIYWGNVSADKWGARTSEVSPEGDILLEFAFPLGYNSYRTPKFAWNIGEEVAGCPDPDAFNYDPAAMILDQSLCQYDLDNDGFTPEMGDCNDNDESINPDAEDIPEDGIDQDCNGEDSSYADLDGDGFSTADGDCDDDNGDINPDADEIPYDGIDQDCDGEDLTDVDGDGFSPEDGDCDDNNADVNPDADEIPYDGIDQDCDGEDLTDVDGDGFSPDDGDCNDDDDTIYPGAEDIPNDGIDQDCDGYDAIVDVIEVNGQSLLLGHIFHDNQLSLTLEAGHELTVMIVDARGRLVAQGSLYSGNFNHSFKTNAASLYHVVVQSDTTLWQLKIVTGR